MRLAEVDCPLIKGKLDEDLCADAAFAAEGFHPERFAPKEIRVVKDWKETCQNCPKNGYNVRTQ